MRRLLAGIGIAIAIVATLGAASVSYSAVLHKPPMSGVIVDSRFAALSASDQLQQTGPFLVDRVVAPGPSWVVVRQMKNGKPGMALGTAAVPAGESRNVIVELMPNVALTRDVQVVLHADRGVVGDFEFAMDRFAESPDKPYFVARAPGFDAAVELAAVVRAK